LATNDAQQSEEKMIAIGESTFQKTEKK